MTVEAETPAGAAEEPGEMAAEFTAEELLQFGKRLHRDDDLVPARKVYEQLLEHDPGNGEAAHFLGMLLFQTGEKEEGLARVESTLRAADAPSDWWNNYGNMLRRAGRHDDAIDALRRAIEIEPESYEAYNTLGLVQKAKGNHAIARACFEKAQSIKPDFGIAWSNLGHLLVDNGDVAEGARALMRAITLSEAKTMREHRFLAHAHADLGEFDKAEAVYHEWLKEESGNPIALHHLAAVTDRAPSRASDHYVTAIFDSFAETFDERLERLDYVAPRLVVAESAAAFGVPRGDLRIADAGCGTGLCGPGLRPFASRLVGVDLSEKMVEKAALRQAYDALVTAELTAWFEQARESFDAIVSADTLCYFGDLAPPLAAFRDRLAPGGGLIFTVEALDGEGDGYKLMHHGRYVHHRAYLEALLERNGLAVETMRLERLRKETGRPVMGYLVRASKPR